MQWPDATVGALSAAEDDALTSASDDYHPVASVVRARAGLVGRRASRVLGGLRA